MKTVELPNLSPYESRNFCYSLITEDGRTAFYYGSCKEYLLDTCHNTVLGLRGTEFREIPLNRVRLLVGCANGESWATKSVEYLNEIEKKAGIHPTQVFRVNNVVNQYLFEGAVDWLLSPPLLSFYAAVPRAMNRSADFANVAAYIAGLISNPFDPYDSHRLTVDARPFVFLLTQHGPKKIFGENLKDNWNMSDIHSCGILTYVAGYLKRRRPNWYPQAG